MAAGARFASRVDFLNRNDLRGRHSREPQTQPNVLCHGGGMIPAAGQRVVIGLRARALGYFVMPKIGSL
jgi:hypothetical protein